MLLCFEDLFECFVFFLVQEDLCEYYVVLMMLFEIVEVMGCVDLKLDLMKEFECQCQMFVFFCGNLGIEQNVFEVVFGEIE